MHPIISVLEKKNPSKTWCIIQTPDLYFVYQILSILKQQVRIQCTIRIRRLQDRTRRWCDLTSDWLEGDE